MADLTPDLLDAIEAAADRATPGPYSVKGDRRQVYERNGCLADCGTQWTDDEDERGQERDWDRGYANAEFFALLDPATVKALVRAARELLQRDADPTCEGCGAPATCSDSEGIQLCEECGKSLAEEQKGPSDG